MFKQVTFFFLAAAIIARAPAANAATKADDSTLKGVREVSVFVMVGRAVREAGIDQAQTQVDVELALRQSRIAVVDGQKINAEAFANPTYDAETAKRLKRAADLSFLCVDISGMKVPAGGVGLLAYRIRVQLAQHVTIARSKAGAMVTTWETEEFGTIGESKVSELRSSVADLINQLCNAYLRVNAEPDEAKK